MAMLQKIITAVFLVSVLFLVAAMAGCGAKQGSYQLSAAWCQEAANKITVMQPEEIPGSIAQEGMAKTGEEFDVNAYFQVLTHLKIKKGYVLDYIYYLGASGGTPVLYTRHTDQPSFRNYGDFAIAGTSVTRPENDVSLLWMTIEKGGTFKYGSQINVKDSAEGYYEYTLMQLLGGQFYLYYKANVYDVRVVATPAEAEKVLESIENADANQIDDDFRKKAKALDLQPVVEIGHDAVKVSVVVFTMWGGFSRVTFTMGRNYPNSITQYDNNVILKYDSGVIL